MDDVISRQAAIDEINHICPVDTEYDCALLDRVDVRCVLSDLPSAGPRWIPAAERVPEVGTYIVTGKQKYDWEYSWQYFVDVAYCPGNYIDNHWDTFNDWYEGQETHIIAWMPLPTPWKGENDAEPD